MRCDLFIFIYIFIGFYITSDFRNKNASFLLVFLVMFTFMMLFSVIVTFFQLIIFFPLLFPKSPSLPPFLLIIIIIWTATHHKRLIPQWIDNQFALFIFTIFYTIVVMLRHFFLLFRCNIVMLFFIWTSVVVFFKYVFV